MKKIIRLGLAFLIISFMVVSFQKFDCAAAVKTINVSKTEASVPTFLAVPHLQKKAPTSQLFSFLKDSPDVIASGTSGTCDWKITADGILTIENGQLATGTVPHGGYDPNGIYTNFGGSNWTANGNKDKIKKVDINPGVSLPKDATAVFANLPIVTEIEGLENLDTSETTNMRYLFHGCSKLTSLNLSNFNTGKVTNMGYMFYGCGNLTSLDVSSFDTSQVTDIRSMFYNCTSLTSLDVSNFNTSQVTDMSYMFYWCTSLTSLDVSNFNTSQVTNMESMFCGSSLTTLDVSNFDTSHVTRMGSIFGYMAHIWKLTLGKNFELKSNSWPNKSTPFLNQVFSDGKFKYTTINSNNSDDRSSFEWKEVGTGSPHKPEGRTYTPYDKSTPTSMNWNQLNGIIEAIKDAAKNKTPITFVWNNEPYNAPPSLVFTDSDQKPIISDDSLRSDKPYTYSYDFRDKDKDFPALNIYGTLRDEDSSQVTLSYWIDDKSTNKKEVKTVDTTSSNGEENKTKVNWRFAITDENDLKALATPQEDGHTIHVEAQDNGTGDPEVFSPASATFKAPVAENAIVDFTYQGLNKEKLHNPQTLVRPLRPPRHPVDDTNDTYGYDVKKYLPQYIWLKDNNNHLLRYGISKYNYLLNNDWKKWSTFNNNSSRGYLASTASEEDLVKKVTLTYDDIGQISFLQVPDLNFGSRIRQATPRKYGLQYSSDKPPRLIVQDTTDSKSWTLYLSITKFINTKDSSKTLDGIFYYDNTPVSSGSEATIAEGGDFNPNTDHIYSISNSWYSDGKQQKDKGPWLNLQDQQPAVGTYQATATWTLKDTPQ